MKETYGRPDGKTLGLMRLALINKVFDSVGATFGFYCEAAIAKISLSVRNLNVKSTEVGSIYYSPFSSAPQPNGKSKSCVTVTY